LRAPAQKSHEEFRFVASWLSDVRSYEREHLVSEVGGDVAYTVAIERYIASRNSRPPGSTELPVTPVCRREEGQRRAVHCHADLKPRDRPAGI
jgi:hypothetical protein